MSDPRDATADMPAWAIRLEAKVDVALARQGGTLERHGERLDDHEGRLRVQESRKTVSPRDLLTSAGAGMALAVGASQLLNTLTK